MDGKDSLYKKISSALLEDGTLSKDFELVPKEEGQIAFAPGAADGIAYIHTRLQEPSGEQLTLMADAVWASSVSEYDRAEELFEQLGKAIAFPCILGTLQKFILDNKDTIDNGAIFNTAVRLSAYSGKTDCVKFGLAMMDLFNTDLDEDVKHLVRTLALSDEFTIYCLYIMKDSWEDGNEEICRTAQKVRGWGRIFAVDLLEPDTEEIREWLLTEGVRNDVLWAYSAIPCWEGSQAAKRLEGRLTQREFEGIRDIICALLDEGPCEGISAVENIDSAVRTFLARARSYRLGPDDYSVINDLKAYYSNKGRPGEFIVRLCEELIKEM